MIFVSGIVEVFVLFRLMNFVDFLRVLGPLQLAVKRMLSDVIKLFILLVLILIGFVCSIYSVAHSYRALKGNPMELWDFHDFISTLRTMTWSFFSILGTEV